jgi:alkylhydroperoxidase family enzyme
VPAPVTIAILPAIRFAIVISCLGTIAQDFDEKQGGSAILHFAWTLLHEWNSVSNLRSPERFEMSLVPYPEIEKLNDEARNALAQAPVLLNIFKMMANAETCYVPLTRLGGAILSKQKLDAKWRELVILMVAKIEGGEYEWVQHVPIGLALGASQDQINAIAAHTLDASCFNEAERTLLRFTEEVINKVRADETTVRDLMKYLSPREIVETIMTIGFYMMAARITETTRTDLDPPAGMKVMDSIRRG